MENPKGNSDNLDIPSFLKRDANNKAEFMRDDVDTADMDFEDETPKAVKAKPKGNGAAPIKAASKPKAKAAVEAKPVKKVASKPAKPAKQVAKAKADKPAKAKAKTEATPKDEFGLRVGSAKSKAIAMYARKNGATLAEVKEKLGSIQLNVLNDLEEKGLVSVERIKEERKGQRPVTRYILKVA